MRYRGRIEIHPVKLIDMGWSLVGDDASKLHCLGALVCEGDQEIRIKGRKLVDSKSLHARRRVNGSDAAGSVGDSIDQAMRFLHRGDVDKQCHVSQAFNFS